MTGIMGKWPSGHGQPTKIRLPHSCRGKSITMAVQFDYHRHGFEGYPGNVGQNTMVAPEIFDELLPAVFDIETVIV